jgi:hypothetical protein
MSYTAFTTHDLLEIVRTIRNPSTFWLDNFFKRQINFQTRYIDFDIVDETQQLAPFVAPTVQGKVIGKDVFDGKRYAPAYVKPKGVVDPSQLIERIAGEGYTGELSLAQRRDAVVADMTRKFKNQIIRRWNWMAAQAALYGQITISSEDYPTVVVDFGRDAGQTDILTGTELWSNSASTPIADIERMASQTLQLSGYGTTGVIMGPQAWSAFIAHASVKELLETRRGSTSTAEVGPGDGKPYQFKGTFGEQNVWVYNEIYEDAAGASQPFMDPRDVFAASAEGFEGVRCFGAILDKKAGWQSLPIFAKLYEQEDPSVEFLLLQSAPLMVPKRPNASWRMRVLA